MPLLFKCKCDHIVTVIKTTTAFKGGTSVFPPRGKSHVPGLCRRGRALQTSHEGDPEVLRVTVTVAVPEARLERGPGGCPAKPAP